MRGRGGSPPSFFFKEKKREKTEFGGKQKGGKGGKSLSLSYINIERERGAPFGGTRTIKKNGESSPTFGKISEVPNCALNLYSLAQLACSVLLS